MRSRPALLLLDLAAVLVFAALGRESHAEGIDVLGVLATASPFLAGATVGSVASRAWRAPESWRVGLTVWLGAVAVGLALRAAVLGRLPVSFAIVATVALGVLVLGWRGALRLVPAVRARQRARLRA